MPREYNPEDTVSFTNITDREFVVKFDGKTYRIGGNETLPFRLPVAQHFAKHLADAILQEKYDVESKALKDPTRKNRARLWMDPERPKLYAKMIPELAEELEKLVGPAEELLASREGREGLQPKTTKTKAETPETP